MMCKLLKPFLHSNCVNCVICVSEIEKPDVSKSSKLEAKSYIKSVITL